MDAVGSERAVIMTSFENASLVMMFAATHPERCAGLVLIDPWVTWTATDETPWYRVSRLTSKASRRSTTTGAPPAGRRR